MKKIKTKSLILLLILFSNLHADVAVFPKQEWESKTPDTVGIESEKVEYLFDLAFQDQATQSAVLIKNGYIIKERYSESYDQESYGTSWSMAKSFYAALIGISIDRGEINSLDDKVSDYVDYYNDERSEITIRQILNMTSGLDFPKNEHESMFFRNDQIAYVKDVGVEKLPEQVFEYNNVNSMIVGEILKNATGISAEILLEDRIFKPIGIDKFTLWKDGSGNPMTYCCIDMSARDYSRFGLLFSRKGKWHNEQIISENYVNETFTPYWGQTPNWWTDENRGYSLHWWISKYDDDAKIFNASGKFGQYIFVDHENDIIFTRITKYHPMPGSQQNWGFLKYIDVDNVDLWIDVLRFLHGIGIIDLQSDITTPNTFKDGESKEFYSNYGEIMDAISSLSK
jgi:CubicO group peptidase (beta-lactamase class C family)